MTLPQASNYRILAGALVLKSFTVNDLARFSKCLPGTVRTTLNRNREFIGPVSSESSGRRGGQPLRYQLVPEREAELERRLKASLPQLPPSTVAPDLRAKIRAELADRLELEPDFVWPSVFQKHAASAGGEAPSPSATIPVSFQGREPETVRLTQFNELAPSGMLVAEDQLGELFDVAESSDRKRVLIEDARESIRAGRAEYESWPAPKKQTPLGLSLAGELETLSHKLQSRMEEVDPKIAESGAAPAYAKLSLAEKSALARELEAIISKQIAKAAFGGGLSSLNNRILIDSLVESDIAFPDGDIDIGPTGDVRADISARCVRVRGRIEGNLIATGEVSLLAGCRLDGDITASRISIEDGAFFRGGIDIRKTDISASRLFAHLADAIEAAKATVSERDSVEAAPVMHQAGLRLSSH